MVTAKDFIAWVYVPLREAWGYIYGTAGIMWTEKLQKSWSQPGHKNYEQTKAYGAQWIGRMVTDCSGLLCWALAQLSDPLRDVVELGVFQDLPYAEVGEILGIPVGTVKSRMSNALKKLKEVLDERRS